MLQVVQHFHAIDIWHAHVGDDQIDWLLLQQFEARAAIFGQIGGIPAVFDLALQVAADDLFVVYDQNVHQILPTAPCGNMRKNNYLRYCVQPRIKQTMGVWIP